MGRRGDRLHQGPLHNVHPIRPRNRLLHRQRVQIRRHDRNMGIHPDGPRKLHRLEDPQRPASIERRPALQRPLPWRQDCNLQRRRRGHCRLRWDVGVVLRQAAEGREGGEEASGRDV